MEAKKWALVFVVGAVVAFGAAAQEAGSPNPSQYFNPNPTKIGEKFSIFFSGNVDDFLDLPDSLNQWNNKILQTLKTFLEQHPEYSIKVRGGTNGDQKGLDAKRITTAIRVAHFVGVPQNRIKATRTSESKDWVAGVGGTNGWMNRRVDFEIILTEH